MTAKLTATTHSDVIGVIVPVYNSEKYLPRCLDSLLAQTHTHFQIVCVNDGSTDQCPAILKSYQAKDDRIHVIDQSNGGVSKARNTGIDYLLKQKHIAAICFIDSDDWALPNMLETLYRALVSSQSDFVSACLQVHENGTLCEKPMQHGDQFLTRIDYVRLVLSLNKQAKYEGSGGYVCKLMIRPQLLEHVRFFEDKSYCEDELFCLGLAQRSSKIFYKAAPVYVYDVHPYSLGHNPNFGKMFYLGREKALEISFEAPIHQVVMAGATRTYVNFCKHYGHKPAHSALLKSPHLHTRLLSSLLQGDLKFSIYLIFYLYKLPFMVKLHAKLRAWFHARKHA